MDNILTNSVRALKVLRNSSEVVVGGGACPQTSKIYYARSWVCMVYKNMKVHNYGEWNEKQ